MSKGYANNAMAAYRAVGAWGGVEAADPQRLVQLMLDAAVDGVKRAQGYLVGGDRPAKAAEISRVVDVLYNLRAALDHEAGGELATRLENLYEYVARRLTLANVRDDGDILEEAAWLIGQIRDAWAALPAQADAPAAATV